MKKFAWTLGLAAAILAASVGIARRAESIEARLAQVESGLRAKAEPRPDTGQWLLETAGQDVFTLTTPYNPEAGGGTGFAIQAPSGRVFTLTNKHICEHNVFGLIDARRTNGKHRLIKILKVGKADDLCLLEGVPASVGLELAPKLSMSEPIYAIGHPYLYKNAITRGYPMETQTIEWGWGPMKALFSTLYIHPGYSGSPVLNESGELVGVVCGTDTRAFYGISIPLETVRRFIARF